MEKKKIHLNFDNIAKDEYKQWTKEAVDEFLDLFPDYKDLFEITTEPIEKDKDCLTKSLTKDELDNLINTAIDVHNQGCPHDAALEQNLRNLFSLQPDGSYKHQPSPDHLEPKKNSYRAFLLLAEQKIKGQNPDHSFPIEVCFCTQPHSGSYGEGGQMSGVTMFLQPYESQVQGKNAAYKKDFFKVLLKHELGHVFQGNVKHCDEKDCIMQDGAQCLPAFEQNHNITFCEDCKNDIRRYMRMIKDPNDMEASNDNQTQPNTDEKDYDEPNNPKHPNIINLIKDTFRGYDIEIRATKEKQEDYPFEYNLYKKGEKAANGAKPTGKITITDEKNVTLRSEDISHFIATMKAVKENGGSAMRLNLIGSEEAKKAFAARAVIAGMITGVEVKNNPYSLDELKEINPMIEKVIAVKKQQEDAVKAAAALEGNTDAARNTDLEKALHTSIDNTYETYHQLSKDALPNFDSLKTFECGVQAIKKAKTRRIAQQVLAQRQSQH